MLTLTKLIILGIAISIATPFTHAFAAPLIDTQDPHPYAVCVIDDEVPQPSALMAATATCYSGSSAAAAQKAGLLNPPPRADHRRG